MRRKTARTQKPDRNIQTCARNCLHFLIFNRFTKEKTQFFKLFGKFLAVVFQTSSQSNRRRTICSRSASQTEINSSGIKTFESSELFGNHNRRVIRKHNSSRTDADFFRVSGNITDHNRSRRARNSRHIVMLGKPESFVTQTFDVLRQTSKFCRKCVAPFRLQTQAINPKPKTEFL